MIDQVTFEKSTYAGLPNKFEAGTPNISGVIASGVGIDYMNSIGLENINKYEIELLDYATRKLLLIEDLKICPAKLGDDAGALGAAAYTEVEQ